MKPYVRVLVCIGFFFSVFLLSLFTLATTYVVFLGIENLSPNEASISGFGIIAADLALTFLLWRKLDAYEENQTK